MRAAVPFLGLLLARLSLVEAAATAATVATTASMAEEKAADPAPEGATSPKGFNNSTRRPVHLRGPDGKGGGRIPVTIGPVSGGKTDVTDTNDKNLEKVTAFVDAHLEAENSGHSYVLVKAEVQVVAGLMYTLHYSANDADGVCTAARVIVVYDRPWLDEMIIKSDTETDCPES